MEGRNSKNSRTEQQEAYIKQKRTNWRQSELNKSQRRQIELQILLRKEVVCKRRHPYFDKGAVDIWDCRSREYN